MSLGDRLIQLRDRTGMNRAGFAKYFGIPYRTVQDWELGNRQMLEYLLRLMEYKIGVERELGGNDLCVDETKSRGPDDI